MGLLEKLKNTFFEEEYIEVEEPTPKVEAVAKKVEPREVVKEKVVEEESVLENKRIENYNDSELAKKNSKLPYFDEDDFVEANVIKKVKKEDKKKLLYGESPEKLYNSLKVPVNNSSKVYSAASNSQFRPTPIISPIYGILDKNYRKEEVVDKKDKPSSYVSRKNADLDSIRRKAYGNFDVVDSVREEPIVEDEMVEENHLLYDMTQTDNKPSVTKVTIGDAEEYFDDLGLEYNIDYKDIRYEKASGRRTEASDRIDSQVDDSDNKNNLEDNLFDLIDSMYEEEK